MKKEILNIRLILTLVGVLALILLAATLWHTPPQNIQHQSNLPQGVDSLTYTKFTDHINKDKNHLYFDLYQAALTGPDAATLDIPSVSVVTDSAGEVLFFKDPIAVYKITPEADTGYNPYTVTKIKGADPTQCSTQNLPACYGDIYKLRTELASIAPQFIDYSKEDSNGREILSPSLAAIQKELDSILSPNEDRDVLLEAVGKRYVAVFVPAGQFGSDKVLDSKTLQTIEFQARFFQFSVGNTALYADEKDLCTYTLDTASCISVPGSHLPSGAEGYCIPGPDGSCIFPEKFSHTDTSFTVPIFKLISAGPGDQKIRDVTFPLPH